MAYDFRNDFLALIRQTSNEEAETARMPGLDYVLVALARAGMFQLHVSQTAPNANQPGTVWLQPSSPSWVAEGTVWLWDASAGAYALATPALWNTLLSPSGYSFQSVSGAVNVIEPGTTILAVQRNAPSATSLVLPDLAAQWGTGRKLKIVDWSTGVVNHAITLITPDGATIATRASWQLGSTADQLAVADLEPVPDLDGWVIE